MNELDLIKRFRDDVPEPSTDAWLRARAAIAAARAETGEPPAHVVPVRHGSPRHRRRLAVLALITVVIATVGVTLALTKHGTHAPVARSDSSRRTTVRSRAGLIRAHVVDALGGETGTILYTRSSTQVAGQPTSNSESWDYPWNGLPGQMVRQAGSGSVGGTIQDKWSLTFTVPSGATSNSAPTTPPGAACNVSGQRIDVDFTHQTWQTSEQSCVALTPGLDAPSAFLNPMTHQLVSNIKTLVADGMLHVVGYPDLNGEQAVELNSNTHGATTLDLWVSARTYLPLQSVTTGPTGDPNPGKTWTEVDQYSFLSPTPANLAHLQVTVPPGFREIVNAPKG
jgi:hypothetical protein